MCDALVLGWECRANLGREGCVGLVIDVGLLGFVGWVAVKLGL